MGREPTAVVDAQLRVDGVNDLRVADGSVMPRVTTGNTMAPCVVIGERAGCVRSFGEEETVMDRYERLARAFVGWRTPWSPTTT